MASSLTLLLPDRGDHTPCCSVDVTEVLDHLIDNVMELKVYRKKTKESKYWT